MRKKNIRLLLFLMLTFTLLINPIIGFAEINYQKSTNNVENIFYDDGTCEDKYTDPDYENKGIVVGFTPKKLGKVTGVNIYFCNDYGSNATVILMQENEYGINMIKGKKELIGLQDNSWNYIDLSEFDFSTDKDFYIGTNQTGYGDAYVGLDTSSENKERTYIKKGRKLDLYKHGNAMIRAEIQYKEDGSVDEIGPEISILSPDDNAIVEDESIEISGLVKDDNAITSVLINGEEAELSLVEDNCYSFKQTIGLEIGENLIKVVATDTLENKSEKIITVIRKEAEPIEEREEIFYDDGTCEEGHAELHSEEGVIVKFTPREIGKVVGVNMYFHGDCFNNKINVVLMAKKTDGSVVIVGEKEIVVENNSWNYIDLSEFAFTTDKDFYIGTNQLSVKRYSPQIGIDTSSENKRRTYTHKGEGEITNFEKGNAMIRASIEYGIQEPIETVPPEIIIINPKDNTTVETEIIEITGTIKASLPIDNILLNKKNILFNTLGKDDSFIYEFKESIGLSYGENQLKIEAIDIMGNKSEKIVTISRVKNDGEIEGEEEIIYDDGICEEGYSGLFIGDGVLVRFSPKEMGIINGVRMYFHGKNLSTRIGVILIDINEDGSTNIIGEKDIDVVNNVWNDIDLSEFNFSTNRDFYIGTIQRNAMSPRIGIDNNGEKSMRTYIHEKGKNIKSFDKGNAMIRALVQYPTDKPYITKPILDETVVFSNTIEINGLAPKECSLINIYINDNKVKEIAAVNNIFKAEVILKEGINKISVKGVINGVETEESNIKIVEVKDKSENNNEEIAYDDGTAEIGYSGSNVGDGVLVKFTPKRLGKLIGTKIYFDENSSNGNIEIVYGNIDDGSFAILGQKRITANNGQWNYVDLSDFDFVTEKDFYIGTVQTSFESPEIGMDISSENKMRTYSHEYWRNIKLLEIGNAMIRVEMEYEPLQGELIENLPVNSVIVGKNAFDIRYLNNNNDSQIELINCYDQGNPVYIKLANNILVNIKGEIVEVDELLNEINYYDADGNITIYINNK